MAGNVFAALAAPVLNLVYAGSNAVAATVLSFDGSHGVSHVFAGTAGDSFPVAGVTISGWINTAQSNANAVILSYGPSAGGNTGRLWITNPAALTVSYGTAPSGVAATGLAVNDGTWRHITIGVTPSDRLHYAVEVWIDGIQCWRSQSGLAFLAGGGLAAGGTFLMGLGQGAPEVGFNGLFSELQIWDAAAMSAAQAAALMLHRAANGATGLALHWPLDVAPAGASIPPADFVASTLCFRQPDLGQTSFASAQWASVAGATSYTLQVIAQDGSWSFSRTGITGNGTIIEPLAGVMPGLSYQARVCAVDASGPGPWSAAATLVPLDLPALAMGFVWPAGGSLSAQWQSVDQAQGYTTALTATTTTSGYQAGTSVDLSAQLTATSALTIAARGTTAASATASGAFGPANLPSSTAQTALGFYYQDPDGVGNGSFCFDWTPALPTPDFFYMELYQGSTLVVADHVAGNTVPPVIIPAPSPVQTGQVFVGRMRRIGQGALADWDSQTVTIHSQSAPAPQYQAAIAPAAEALDLVWGSVAAGATYNFETYTDGATVPVIQTGVTSPYGLMGLLSPDQNPTNNHTYMFKLRAVIDGDIGPASTVTPAPSLTSTFRYVWQGVQDPGTLSINWTPATGSAQAYARVFSGGAVTPADFGLVPVTQGSFSVAAPGGGFVAGTSYFSQLRGLDTGSMSAALFGQVVIHQMSTPAVQLAQTQPGTVAIEARWLAVDPQLTTSYLPVLNGVEGTLQATRTLDLTSHLDDIAALSVQVRAEADQSYGPLSATAVPAALNAGFSYLLTLAGVESLTASWTAAPLVYLSILTTGAPPANQQLFGDGTTARYAFPVPAGGFTEDDVYTLSIKSAAAGMLGAMTAVPVTIHKLAQPAPAFQSPASANPVTLQWADVRTQAQVAAGLAVAYEVVLNGVAVANQPAGLSYALSAAQLSAAGAQSFTVQPNAQGSWGVISVPQTLAAPVAGAITYDAGARPQQIALTWAQSAGATGYYVELTDAAGTVLAMQWVAQPTLQASFDASSLTLGASYTVQVRALAGGALTAFASGTLTIQRLVGPSSLVLTQAVALRQIVATWQFDTSGLAGVTYVAQLRQTDGTVLDTQTPGTTTATLTYPSAIAVGTTLNVYVRASSGGNLGLWTGPQPVVVGSILAQVTGVAASFDTNNALSVSWNAVSGSNVTYTILVTPAAGGTPYTKTGATGTSISLPQTTTGVVNNTTYNIQVQAVAASQTGPSSGQVQATTGQPTPSDPGGGGGSGSSGDPVLLANGSYIYSHIDLEVVAAAALQFEVRYNTVTPLPTDNPPGPSVPLGKRWTHRFATRIQKATDAGTVAVWWGDSTISIYTVPGSITGTYSKQGQPNGDVLVCLPNLTYQLTRRDQTVYTFDSSGVLQRIVSPEGNGLTLTYVSRRLDRVTDEGSGRYLAFSYFTSGDDTGRIRTVVDNAGRTISYAYTNGDLTLFTDAAGLTRRFTYAAGSLMQTAVDQLGNTFITNTYTQNRVTQQMDGRAVASGQNYFISFAYQDQTINGIDYVQTTVTDRKGYVTVSLNEKLTLNTVSEIHTLAAGGVWRVLRGFDGMGNLVSQTVYQGPANGAADVGATTTYTYDGARNLLSITDPLGQTSRFTYDSRNNLTSASDAYGNLTTVTYVPGTSLPRSITYPTGRKQILTYQTVGTIQGLIDSLTDYPVGDGQGSVGNVTSFQYFPTGEVHQVTDPLGGSTVMGYDTALGLLTSLQIKDAVGALAFTVNATYWPGVDRVRTNKTLYPTQPDAQGYVTTAVFDGVGMLTSVTDPLQRTTSYHYDANSQLDRITYPAVSNPNRTQLVRDRNDKVIQQVLSASNPTVQTGYGYDEIGRLTSITDGNGNITRIAWSMSLQPAGTASPMVATITLPTVTVTTPGQAPVAVSYQRVLTFDAIGRLISRTDSAPTGGALSPATTIAYAPVAGANGTTNTQVTTTYPKADPSQPTPYQVIAVYDPMLRLLSYTDERGKVWTMSYGGVVDAVTQTTQSTVTTTDPVGVQTIETKDAKGRDIALTIGKGTSWRTKSVSYDALDRPVRIEEPNPAPNPTTPTVATTISYTYDPATQCVRIAVTPYQTAAFTLVMDGADQVVSVIDAHGIATTMSYNQRGQLLTYTNGRQQALTYGYDPAGRSVSTAPPNAATLVQQVLDGAGNRQQTNVGGAVQITRTFDALNRLLTRTMNAYSETVAYSYTPTNDIATVLYPGLTAPLTYGYDEMRRLRTVTDWAGRQTTYGFAPNGFVTSAALPNAVNLSFSQDDAGNFTGYQASIGTDLLAQASYTLDAFGQPSQITELTPLAANVSASVTTFSYGDPAPNRLTAVNGVAVTYDDDGNMTSVPGVTGALNHNIYNQLVQIGAASFAFDADGLLDTSSNGAATRRFVHDPAGYANPMVARADQQQTPVATLFAQLLSGGAAPLPDDQALTSPWSAKAPIDRPLATVDTGGSTTRYIHGIGLIGRETVSGEFQSYVFNGVGSTLALVGASGMTDAYAYDPYGAPAGRQGISDNPFALHGRWGVISDPSGLCFMRARTYAPTLARFLEKDPALGNLFAPQALNGYSFEPNNPLQFLDPLGLSGGKDDGGGGHSGGTIAAIVIGVVVGGVLVVIGGGVAVAAVFAEPAAAAFGASIRRPTLLSCATVAQRIAFYSARAVQRVASRSVAESLKAWASNRAEAAVARTSIEMTVRESESATLLGGSSV